MNINYSAIENTPRNRQGFDRYLTATTTNNKYSVHFVEGYRLNSYDEPEIYYTRIQVSPISSYDLQDYAWAEYDEESENVEIIRKQRRIFTRHIDGIQSLYDMDGDELTILAQEDFGEFECMYDEWFTGVIEQIIILLQKENSKYNPIIDRT